MFRISSSKRSILLGCVGMFKASVQVFGGASASVGIFQGEFSPLQGGVWNVWLFFGVKLPDFSPLVGLKGEWTIIVTVWVFTMGESAWVRLDFLAGSLFPYMTLINWSFSFLPQNKKWGGLHCSHFLRTPEECVSRTNRKTGLRHYALFLIYHMGYC